MHHQSTSATRHAVPLHVACISGQSGRAVVRSVFTSAAAAAAAVQLGVQGILVLDTRKGGPAAKAGIQGTSRDTNGRLMLGDIIVAFNRKPIRWASH